MNKLLLALYIMVIGQNIMATDINQLIRPYSSQKIIELDPNESFLFSLKDGSLRNIRLIEVREKRDPVVGLICQAAVRVAINDKPIELTCQPYKIPTEIDSLRIKADTTAGFGSISKKVQLSLWDSNDPIVNTQTFSFPLADYLFMSHATQAYGEPVWLGNGDSDPSGIKIYHDYGFDIAGYDAGESVLCAAAGEIVFFWPDMTNLCSVVVRSDNGFIWEYAHLNKLQPGLNIGSKVLPGQKLGILGKTGPSGNFSHLHLGTYLCLEDTTILPGHDTDKPNRRLDLYPWLVTAYQSQHKHGLIAVARPHQMVLAGDQLELSGSDSLAWGDRKISKYKWELPDGTIINDPDARFSINSPGTYIATLTITDQLGDQDIDFCQIKVYPSDKTREHMPHIFMSRTPARDLTCGEQLSLRFWLQGSGPDTLKIDTGDDSPVIKYQSDTPLTHIYKKPGIYTITATCLSDGMPITQKLKVKVK